MNLPDPKTFPAILYGTAWKKDATANLVKTAINAGFRAIDTANQPKHYHEPGVGDALVELARAGVTRDQLFLQTKFTPPDGQDERVPYDPNETITHQVEQSVQSSLDHLHTDHLDSFLLHGPYTHPGLGESDWEVWAAIEQIYKNGQTKWIGVSNVNAHQLQLFVEKAQIKPMVVQNRCYASSGWDRSVREFCKENGIVYQGFSLLTANSQVLRHPEFQTFAKGIGMMPTQLIFAFARQIGMVVLTGTSSEEHMREDLKALTISLSDEDLETMDHIAGDR